MKAPLTGPAAYDIGMDGPVEPEDLFWSPGDAELDPLPIATRLVREVDQFRHLREGEASILFLMRTKEEVKQGRVNLGKMILPAFSGPLAAVGTWMLARLCEGVPDFIMLLDATWWRQATPLQREALVFHELLHGAHKEDKFGEPLFTPEGRPVWALRGHDIEEFDDVVRRYGAWKGDITAFIDALRDGGAI